jgi:hypothetical protein
MQAPQSEVFLRRPDGAWNPVPLQTRRLAEMFYLLSSMSSAYRSFFPLAHKI